MNEIAKRLHEQRQIEKAKQILEAEGYDVTMNEDEVENKRNIMRDNPTFKKMDAICQKYGYSLRVAYVEVYKSGSRYPSVSINKVQKYHPDIYYNTDFFGEKVSYFEIQTTSYGAMKLDEYEVFLKGCQDAHDLVVELNKIDLNTLVEYEQED